MQEVINPFLTTGYQGPAYFCDRESETSQIVRYLQSGQHITLISPRRMGKSSLIKHVFHTIKESTPAVDCFYIDLYPTKTLDQLVAIMSREILSKLKSKGEKAFTQALTFFQSLRPTMTFDAYTGAPEFSVDINPTQAQHTLESILDYMEQSGKRIYVAIDEFQQILYYDDKNTEALLRSKIQFMKNVTFLFSGSEQHTMSEIFLSPEHPFFHSTSIVQIKEINQQKYLEFANRFLADLNIALSSEAFNYLYQEVDGQTWYVQKLLSSLYFQRPQELSLEVIRHTIDITLSEQEPAFQFLCHNLSANQLKLLQAIAREGRVTQPYGKDFIRKYHLSTPSSIKATLKVLIQQQLVYPCLDNSYIVYDRFLGMWLRR